MPDDEATGWFEPLYAAAAAGTGSVPWDGGRANPLLGGLVPPGAGRAVVVGCGLGDDADLVARAGWDTTAFDVAPTALRLARDRFPDAPVHWAVADLLALPEDWRNAFDLVLEHYTVQALPPRLRAPATAAVRSLVAPGGTLLVLASATEDAAPDRPGPPWRLTRAEAKAFGADWTAVRFEAVDAQWLAAFRRPAVAAAANARRADAAVELTVRPEREGDVAAVRAVTTLAFRAPENDPPVEPRLLDALRADAAWIPALSLVAEAGGEVVGHVVCTRGACGRAPALGLGPLSVRPDAQGRGVGSALVRAVLAVAADRGERLVALLGDEAYYSRFGFVGAASLGVQSPDPAWGAHFQALPLAPRHPRGAFRYAAPFEAL